jgi:hypothetical protein
MTSYRFTRVDASYESHYEAVGRIWTTHPAELQWLIEEIRRRVPQVRISPGDFWWDIKSGPHCYWIMATLVERGWEPFAAPQLNIYHFRLRVE